MNHIIHNLSGLTVEQRMDDGYLNATALAKAYQAATGIRKDVRDWLITDRAKAYLEHLSNKIGVPVSQLVIVKKGNSKQYQQGTWLHPKLAIPFATWLSIEFEFQVSEWVEQWMSRGVAQTEQEKVRLAGKVTRRQLVDAVASYIDRHPELSENSKQWLYVNTSTRVTLVIFGRKTNKLAEDLNADKKHLRDFLTPFELLLIQEVEDTAIRLIDLHNIHPDEAIKQAAERLLIPVQLRKGGAID